MALTGVNTYRATQASRGRLLINNNNQLGNAAGSVAVTTPAVEIIGDMTSSRLFLNNNSTQVDDGKTDHEQRQTTAAFSLVGPITTTGANSAFNGVRGSNSLTINANAGATFSNFDNGGTLNLAAAQTFKLNTFTNTPSGKLFVDGTANVSEFVSDGQITVAAFAKLVNVGASGLTFGFGSVTTVNSAGAANRINDGFIDLGSSDALLSGLMINNGVVGSATNKLNVNFGGFEGRWLVRRVSHSKWRQIQPRR